MLMETILRTKSYRCELFYCFCEQIMGLRKLVKDNARNKNMEIMKIIAFRGFLPLLSRHSALQNGLSLSALL
jgi:hypothetical protein